FIIYCIAYFLFGFTTENLFFMGLSLWFIAGFAIATADASVDAILQSTVPQNLQGRVFTVLGSINASMIPIGLIVLGVIADAAGIRMIYHIGGVAMLILLLPVFYFGNLMNFEKNRKENDSYT
ncbi:MAG: MFS transporter, partial [Dehalococcoidales bacterium]|nr:MFS transporter [Dehalococcoidales bacterium]